MGDKTEFIRSQFYRGKKLTEEEVFILVKADERDDDKLEEVSEDLKEVSKITKLWQNIYVKITAGGTGTFGIYELFDLLKNLK